MPKLLSRALGPKEKHSCPVHLLEVERRIPRSSSHDSAVLTITRLRNTYQVISENICSSGLFSSNFALGGTGKLVYIND